MNAVPRIVNTLVAPLLVLLVLFLPLPSLASDAGGAAPEPMVFTVNLGKENFLQFGVLFETASPEATHLLASYKPKIQHEIILLLSGKESAKLRLLEGKKELIADLIKLSNRIIDEDESTGVKDVLFSKFLIQ